MEVAGPEAPALACAEMDGGDAFNVTHGSVASTLAVNGCSDQLARTPRYIDNEAAAGAQPANGSVGHARGSAGNSFNVPCLRLQEHFRNAGSASGVAIQGEDILTGTGNPALENVRRLSPAAFANRPRRYLCASSPFKNRA